MAGGSTLCGDQYADGILRGGKVETCPPRLRRPGFKTPVVP